MMVGKISLKIEWILTWAEERDVKKWIDADIFNKIYVDIVQNRISIIFYFAMLFIFQSG